MSSAPKLPARILEISAFPPPRAGWSVRVEFLKRQLLADGHACAVLNIGSSRLIPSPEYDRTGGVDYVRKVWRYTRSGYTVHAHVNGDSPKGFILTLLAEVLGVLGGRRPFLTFHAGIDQVFFPRRKSGLLVPMFWLLFLLPRRIICNTEAVKEKILEYGVPGDKIVAIPAFSKQYLEYRPTRLDPEVERFFAAHAVLFSYIRVRRSFDLTTLIEAFAQLAVTDPRVGLLLVGVTEDVDASLWDECLDLMRHNKIEARVCVVEELDHDRFRTALSRAAVCIRTPTSDGASSSVLESLALGIPVVAADNGTRPSGVITYDAGNPAALADRIRYVLRNLDSGTMEFPRPMIADTLAQEVAVLAEG